MNWQPPTKDNPDSPSANKGHTTVDTKQMMNFIEYDLSVFTLPFKTCQAKSFTFLETLQFPKRGGKVLKTEVSLVGEDPLRMRKKEQHRKSSNRLGAEKKKKEFC